MPELRVKLLLNATRPYSAILDACAVITASMKWPENNFQLTVGRWKFNFHPNQHLSNKGIKQTINCWRIVLIGYWRVKKKVIVQEFFLTALNVFYSPNVFETVNLLTILSLILAYLRCCRCLQLMHHLI